MIQIAFQQSVKNSRMAMQNPTEIVMNYFCLLGGPTNSNEHRVSSWKRKPMSEMASRHGRCNTCSRGSPGAKQLKKILSRSYQKAWWPSLSGHQAFLMVSSHLKPMGRESLGMDRMMDRWIR